MRRAVGLVEQVLDGCRAGAPASALERLIGVTSGREIGLDHDDDWVPAPAAPTPPRRPSSPEDGQTLVAAFAAEALEALDQCEDRVLTHELSPDDGDLGEVCADLATIADAAAAVDVDVRVGAGPDVDALLDEIDVLRERIESAWAGADAVPVDATDDAAARGAVPAPAARRARRGAPAGRAARARRARRRAVITVGLAGRIFDPLAQMIADAAELVTPGTIETLRLHAERDAKSLRVHHRAVRCRQAADPDESEALHWIDARRPAATPRSTACATGPARSTSCR